MEERNKRQKIYGIIIIKRWRTKDRKTLNHRVLFRESARQDKSE